MVATNLFFQHYNAESNIMLVEKLEGVLIDNFFSYTFEYGQERSWSPVASPEQWNWWSNLRRETRSRRFTEL